MFREEIRDTSRKKIGLTAFTSTHDQEEALLARCLIVLLCMKSLGDCSEGVSPRELYEGARFQALLPTLLLR